MSINQGDLARAVVHEPSEEWPTRIEIAAYWAHNGSRGRRRVITIDADQFFGRGAFGAPMSGEQLIGMVNKLRKDGPHFGMKRQSKARTPGGARWGKAYGVNKVPK